MKRILTLTLVVLTSVTMLAQGYSFLNVAMAGGSAEGNALTAFDHITFSSGQMHLLSGTSEIKTYNLASLSKMWLSTTSGIRNIESNNVFGPTEIYLISGKRVTGDINSLPKGIYIVKDGNGTHKLIRR